MIMAWEQRNLQNTSVKAVESNDGMLITGIAAPANSWSRVISDWAGVYYERFATDAKVRFPEEIDVVMNHQHDRTLYLARQSNNSLRLTVNGGEVSYEANLPDTQLGRDVYKLIDREDITDVSIVFRANEEEWDYYKDVDRRTITDYTLKQISTVDIGAYADTTISKRALEHLKNSEQKRKYTDIEHRRRLIRLIELEK